MTDEVKLAGGSESASSEKYEVGKLLLSPTRTFAPVLKEVLEDNFEAIHGLIHCSGGGQTKCMKYMPNNVRVVKDNLFEPPPIFQLIQRASKSNDREMYQVFNMGTRMEIYANEKNADQIIGIAKKFDVDAQVIGRVEESNQNEQPLIVSDQNHGLLRMVKFVDAAGHNSEGIYVQP